MRRQALVGGAAAAILAVSLSTGAAGAARGSGSPAAPVVTALSPSLDARGVAGTFVATAALSGPGATAATLTITLDGGSAALFSVPMKIKRAGGGYSARVAVSDLAPGPYVALWRVEGGDGSYSSAYSSFVVGGASLSAGRSRARSVSPRATAAADAPLYLDGSGTVGASQFRDFFVAGPNGENPRGWLSIRGALPLHAVVTCASLREDAAVFGYLIDSGQYYGRGLLISIQFAGPGGGGGYVVYSGVVAASSPTCPAPGDPTPSGFLSTGSGPIQNGTGQLSSVPPAGPPSIVDLVPPTDGSMNPGVFFAYAGFNGDGVTSTQLELDPEGGSAPTLTTPMGPDAGGLDAKATIPRLRPAPYVGVWTITRADGSTATTLSSFAQGPRTSASTAP